MNKVEFTTLDGRELSSFVKYYKPEFKIMGYSTVCSLTLSTIGTVSSITALTLLSPLIFHGALLSCIISGSYSGIKKSIVNQNQKIKVIRQLGGES